MRTIEWLPLASTNRFEQLDYIAQDNPLAAISQDERIEHQIDMLLQGSSQKTENKAR